MLKHDGMYAMSMDANLHVRELGGPFNDIDDVLDACFDDMMEMDSGADTMLFVEVVGGQVAVNSFPVGAFPTKPAIAAD